MPQVYGRVIRVWDDMVAISARVGETLDEMAATPKTPGFNLLSGVKAGSLARVEVEIIPPRTSALTHLVITEILGVD